MKINRFFNNKLKYIVAICVLLVPFLNVHAQRNLAYNKAAYHSSAINYDNTGHLTTDGWESTFWQSKSDNNEWLYVDLGKTYQIKAIELLWGENYASSYKIQFAVDKGAVETAKWIELFYTSSGKGGEERPKIKSFRARYVRILCLKANQKSSFILKEFRILGKGGSKATYSSFPEIDKDGNLFLHGGNWKLQRKSFVEEEGEIVSQSEFNDKKWIPATVPGTILTSYHNIGAIPDMLYGDQQLQISDSFFTADFWYRCSFNIPETYKNKRIWLNFNGINWKADIYLNGNKIGRINGAYIRGKFDITEFISKENENTLAVLVYKNDNPGAVTEQFLNDPDGNGGIIGYDSPTILASIGWNWIPTIRGRNTGIWNDVYLNSTNSVSILNPYIQTDFDLPDTTNSNIIIEVELQNNKSSDIDGILNILFHDKKIKYPVVLKANELKKLKLTKEGFPELTVNNPKLWWPNGYGAQNLNTLKLNFTVNEKVSDQKDIVFGFRKYTYLYDNNHLKMSVNGVPVIIRGGNWGLPEAMLRCDKEKYDLFVRLHKEMNLNMIRNWLGMTGHDGFYEACDKYGIMIWDDFWLANPVDGPHPKDNKMFMDNVIDKIKNRRNHASLAIWCGRNEGYPPAELDSAMNECISLLDNSRHYVPSSAHRPVTGLGPYEIKDPKWYFKERGTTLHTEQGIVCVPSKESMHQMMPKEYLWPINDMWGKHDWTQERVAIYKEDMKNSYGEASNLEDFCKKAQMLNMEGPKAMMETWQSNRGGGVIIWMTHPAWPSLICQTYDYYLEPTAAYFAIKKGSSPIHIMWRADNNKVQLINNTHKSIKNLIAKVSVYDFFGKSVQKNNFNVESAPNSVKDICALDFSNVPTKISFIKLEILNKKGELVNDNFYWRSSKYSDYNKLEDLPKVKLNVEAKRNISGNKTTIDVKLSNNSNNVALMVRLKVVKKRNGKRILPITYQDNYFSLPPKESKTIAIIFENKYLQNDIPELSIEGWNIIPEQISIDK